jgi:uncharacterized protein (DUF736 family)
MNKLKSYTMAYEQKTNTGTVFQNQKKADNHPDFRGEINVNGKLLEIALWWREGAKGKYLSASIQEPRPKQEKPVANDFPKLSKPEVSNNNSLLDTDDLPF